MSYFRGCNNLVTFNMFLFIFSWAAVAQENILYQLSTREEMVAMAGYGEDKISNVLVAGTLVCEACLHGHSQLQSWPISGAVVAFTCHHSAMKSRTGRKIQAITDENGEFIIDVPSELHVIQDLDKRCSVRVLRVPKSSLCRPRYRGTRKRLKLSSFGNGIRTYTAGNIKFLHSSSRPNHACIARGGRDNDMEW